MTLVGYIVANDQGEFLAGYRTLMPDVAWLAWALVPGLALTFSARTEAQQIVVREQRYPGHLAVCELWDAGTQWVVDQPEDNAA